jgi:hypothetical protein
MTNYSRKSKLTQELTKLYNHFVARIQRIKETYESDTPPAHLLLQGVLLCYNPKDIAKRREKYLKKKTSPTLNIPSLSAPDDSQLWKNCYQPVQPHFKKFLNEDESKIKNKSYFPLEQEDLISYMIRMVQFVKIGSSSSYARKIVKKLLKTLEIPLFKGTPRRCCVNSYG